MNRRKFVSTSGALVMGLGIGRAPSLARGAQPDKLPQPGTIDVSLTEALRNRRSTRVYEDKDLPEEVLSSLLWAAWGVNRPDSGKRTAPSARNKQENDIYVTRRDGFFLYDAREHALIRKGDQDIRALTGMQPYAAPASVNLVYVADMDKAVDDLIMVGAGVGCICQNVYLFCAAQGLATVVRGSVDAPALSKVLNLRPNQRITLAQCVGYQAG